MQQIVLLLVLQLSLLVGGVIPTCNHCLEDPNLPIRIDSSTGHWRDAKGRARLFHGVNAVQKSFPVDVPALNSTDFAFMQSHGWNALRLGALWSGVMPVDDVTPNTTYLNALNTIVEEASQYGIHTIIDAHQDLAAPSLCGEGSPEASHLSLRPSTLNPNLLAPHLQSFFSSVPNYMLKASLNAT